MSVNKLLVVCVVGIIASTGCASKSKTERLDDDFGKSVRNMISAQIYNPEAARNPPAEPPRELDGEKGELLLKTYRQDVAKPKDIGQAIQIRIGK